jgi:transposase
LKTGRFLAVLEGCVAMNAEALFTAVLQLGAEWKVVRCEVDHAGQELTVHLDFVPGSRFVAPGAAHQLLCPVHDTVERRWRHLNFWQYRTTITARVPRVQTPEGRVVLIEVPWARAGSGFTLLMEALAMLLVRDMPVRAVAELLGEEDTRLWRVVQHYVAEAAARESWAEVRRVCVDETSARRGHRYVTCVVDADTRRLLFLAEGRSGETLGSFVEALRAHGGTPEQIELVSIDMSPAYQKGAGEHLPGAQIVFDRFHLMQLAGQALDAVRKELRRAGAELSGALWAIRGNEWTRSAEELARRRALCAEYPKLGRAVMLRELLQDVLGQEDAEPLRWWCQRAKRARLAPFRELAETIQKHWAGVAASLACTVNNGVIEALNGIIQLAKRMARGFRSFANFRTIALLKAGKLSLHLPQLSPT